MGSKDTLHRLVDALPETAVDEAERRLQALSTEDPVWRAALLAPLDDEAETPEESAALAEGREAIARGDVYSLEDVRRELGL
ncbi:MAG TPA: hypothetical protein VK066_08630 [Chloroflexota bacterium]|nr:hypothetical protein [Chloroflexota bacterium]